MCFRTLHYFSLHLLADRSGHSQPDPLGESLNLSEKFQNRPSAVFELRFSSCSEPIGLATYESEACSRNVRSITITSIASTLGKSAEISCQ